ncbi:Universal stress protein UspA [Sphingobium herbicidovorans NBRC 16415]|uniref:Universal stress protein UspA n=1 Tax=Sphingobium herbicidovorans (strain ATCC 700291 / DSM 11019 / CCUG 56400 / KCTC 2939 / LMG 18315 / NBRC 16415 / MH) TaxID=1219045 RepID=A0A086P9F2_SPHHM|nr:universal stress protein [Sphingobium herbicidovorans]KFG90020.1 Universal stress protein UspA [Sphingobium herbicidovorans NBRC 16415]
MKNVLLLVHDDAGQEARLQAALDLTRCLSGHLTCLDVVQVPVLAGSEYYPDAELMLLQNAQKREEVNAGRIRARLQAEDVAWSWVDRTGFIASLLQESAALADIIVLNTSIADRMTPDMAQIVSDTVLKSGKPILAVPDDSRGIDFGGHVLAAWDGSRPAAQALRAAAPLLASAQGVTIIEMGEVSGELAEDAAAYLSRHGVRPRVEHLDEPEAGVAAGLLAEMDRRRPAFCIMGAYGHSRLRESLFGGITRIMLGEANVPLFLAH